MKSVFTPMALIFIDMSVSHYFESFSFKMWFSTRIASISMLFLSLSISDLNSFNLRHAAKFLRSAPGSPPTPSSKPWKRFCEISVLHSKSYACSFSSETILVATLAISEGKARFKSSICWSLFSSCWPVGRPMVRSEMIDLISPNP